MPTRCLRLLLALAVLGSTVAAAVEPNLPSVFGIGFRAKLNVPKCPYGGGSTVKSGPCVSHEKSRSKSDSNVEEVWINFPFGELPSWVYASRFQALLIDGGIERVWIMTTGTAGQAAALSSLTQKYGKPVGLSPASMQNGFGATFQTFEAVWQDGDTSVVFNSIVEGTDKGTVTIGTFKGNQMFLERLQRDGSTRRRL